MEKYQNYFSRQVCTQHRWKIAKIKKIKKWHLCLTYGDGLSNVNNCLKNFIKTIKIQLLSLQSLDLVNFQGKRVKNFEKIQVQQWMGSGEWSQKFKYLPIKFRRNFFRKIVRNQLMAYLHDGFWYCMDTPRDKDNLDLIWRKKNVPWKKW